MFGMVRLVECTVRAALVAVAVRSPAPDTRRVSCLRRCYHRSVQVVDGRLPRDTVVPATMPAVGACQSVPLTTGSQ